MRLGIKAKFFLYSNSLVVVTMAIVTLLWVLHEKRSRYEAVAARGRSIAEVMAIPITDALMDEDHGLARRSRPIA